MSDLKGLVIYCDGSYRQSKGGYGVYAYSFKENDVVKNKKGFVPTRMGFKKGSPEEEVIIIDEYRRYGTVDREATNNSAELLAYINALQLVLKLKLNTVIRTDSEYVIKGAEKHMLKWKKNNWCKSDGQEIKSVALWKQIDELLNEIAQSKIELETIWVQGHNGEPGNEEADILARTGSGYYRYRGPMKEDQWIESIHNVIKYEDLNPLVQKQRLLFKTDTDYKNEKGQHIYYTFSLGEMRNYGIKQDDSTLEKLNKTDIIVGRRISDAFFSVCILNEEDPLINKVIENHESKDKLKLPLLNVIRLDNLFTKRMIERYESVGDHAFIYNDIINGFITPDDKLITKTLVEPRLAQDAYSVFGVMYNRLLGILNNENNEGITLIDITDDLYCEESKGNKTIIKLRPTITNTTVSVDLELKDAPLKKVRLLPGIDIPNRNMLAKLADQNPKVQLALVHTGPKAIGMNVIFQTSSGQAIFGSPYTHFVI